MSQATNYDTLPFSSDKQLAFLGYLIEQEKLFLQCYSRIKPSWFTDGFAQMIWAQMVELHSRLKRPPTPHEVMNDESWLREDPARRNKVKSTITNAMVLTGKIGLDTILPELTTWSRQRLIWETVQKTVSLHNTKKVDEAWEVMRRSVKDVDEIVFDQGKEESMDFFPLVGQNAADKQADAVTWGLDTMDNLLLPGQTNGSLLLGDTTVLLAPTNVGKTTAMITTACANVVRGNPVLLITHEGRPDDIKEKLWCCYLGVTRQELYRMYETGGPAARKEMEIGLRLFNENLLYVPVNKAGMTVEELGPIVRRKCDEWAAKRGGKGFKLFIDDYPAKLITQLATKGNLQRRHIDDIVYNHFVQYGLEFNFHVLCAIQTNRSGSKANRNEAGEDRLLAMEDVSESFGPMQAATNVISINRDLRARASNRVTFYICKSRSSETDIAVCCKSAYHYSRTHHNDYGAIWYRSNSVMTERIDELLTQYKGREVPLNELRS